MKIEFEIFEKLFWSGIAAGGFAVLFNTPRRIIPAVLLLGSIAGFIKFFCLLNDIGIILSSLYAASFVGFASLISAKKTHSSPFIVSIPSIIPMIPGYFGYETLLGIMRLALKKGSYNEIEAIMFVTQNALNLFFILACLSIGVSLPWLLLREKGIKKMKITNEGDLV